MSTRNWILLAVAIVIVVVAFTVRQPERTAEEKTEMVKVVVAKHDIAPYTVIYPHDLQEQTIPKAYVSSDTYRNWVDLRNSRLISAVELRRGTPLKQSEILTLGDEANWVEGEMLISSFYVPTDRVVGGQLRPGHHVDILATQPGRAESSEAFWLARNLWVVGVHQSSGTDIPRPTVAIYEEATPEPTKATSSGGGLLSGLGGRSDSLSGSGERTAPTNLVVVAVDQETARMMGYYLGARLYDAWVYIRPEQVSESSPPVGRIDGIVFEDVDNSGQVDANEPGLSGVVINLDDKEGQTQQVITDSTGRFSFEKLAAGIYTIEEVDPPGYVSTTRNRKTIYVAEDQNVYVAFGDIRAVPVSQQAEATAEPTDAPQQPTPEPTPSASTATDQEEVCQLHMSDREGGAHQVTAFPQGVEAAWAVVTFENCTDATLGYQVSVRFPDATEYVLKTGTWDGKTRTISVRIPQPDVQGMPQALPAGTYTTILKTGVNSNRDEEIWTVGGSDTNTDVDRVSDTGLAYGRGR